MEAMIIVIFLLFILEIGAYKDGISGGGKVSGNKSRFNGKELQTNAATIDKMMVTNAFPGPEHSQKLTINARGTVLGDLLQSKASLSNLSLNRWLTKSVNFLQVHKLSALSHDLVELLDRNQLDIRFEVDIKTITSVMLSCIRHKLYEDVLALYDAVQRKGMKCDAHFYSLLLRASMFARSWHSNLSLLETVARDLPGDELEPVIHSMITNLIYTSGYTELAPERSFALFDIMLECNCRATQRVADAMLIVLCKYGDTSDINRGLKLIKDYRLSSSIHTYNALLHHAAVKGGLAYCEKIVDTMRQKQIEPDEYSYQMLLKACSIEANIQRADEIYKEMQQKGLPISPKTHMRWTEVYQRTKQGRVEQDYITHDSADLYRNGIRNSDDLSSAVRWFKQAVEKGLADTQVYLAMTQCYANYNKTVEVHNLLEHMLADRLCNEYVVSFVISYSTQQSFTMESIDKLMHYLMSIKTNFPQLLTFSTEQQLMKELLAQNQTLLAVGMNRMVYGKDTELSPDVFRTVFEQLKVIASSRNEQPTNTNMLVIDSSDGIEYAVKAVEEKDDVVSHLIEDIVNYIDHLAGKRLSNIKKWLHGNDVGNMLQLCNALQDKTNFARLFDIIRTDELKFKPTALIISEAVRFGRKKEDRIMIKQAILWGLRHRCYLSFVVISDAIAGLYSLGKTDDVLEIYDLLYKSNRLQHWVTKDKSELTLDLHGFGRGMAFAAINIALNEIKGDASLTAPFLTVITGQNLRDESGDKSYTLMNELQEVLVEGSFPPIPTSTVPGNVGRLFIDLTYVHNNTPSVSTN